MPRSQQATKVAAETVAGAGRIDLLDGEGRASMQRAVASKHAGAFGAALDARSSDAAVEEPRDRRRLARDAGDRRTAPSPLRQEQVGVAAARGRSAVAHARRASISLRRFGSNETLPPRGLDAGRSPACTSHDRRRWTATVPMTCRWPAPLDQRLGRRRRGDRRRGAVADVVDEVARAVGAVADEGAAGRQVAVDGDGRDVDAVARAAARC